MINSDDKTNDSLKNSTIFYIGLVLLIALCSSVLFVDIFLNKSFSPISYEIIKVLLAVSCTLIFSQLPNVLNIDLPLGIKAAGGIAFGILIYFYSPNFVNNKPNPYSVSSLKKDSNLYIKDKKLKIFILQSGGYEYSYNVIYSFINKLRDSLEHTRYELEPPSVLTGSSESFKEASVQSDYRDKLENIFIREHYDYYITIGSSASSALSKYLKAHKNLDNINHLFLGVTDPVILGLTSSLSPDRNDIQHRNVGGVAYCGNYEELPNKIMRLFPNKKICYIYNTSVIEDEHLAKRFSETDLVQDGNLLVKPINHMPSIIDFKDHNLVYFSWSTFDDTFANNFLSFPKDIYVVSTTAEQAKFGLVPIAISTSDDLIGLKGAEILLENLLNNKPLGDIDIFVPPWKSYVNTYLAAEKYHVSKDLIEHLKNDEKY